jgi:uncharacterized protein YodC (DUF2158 family)
MEYKTGDKVQLISGGPDMTVKGIVGTESLNKMENLALKSSGNMEGDVYCQWFNNTKLEGGVFKPTMLKKL